VEQGTGTRAQVSGAIVGGKTGTADPGTGAPSNVWFTGWAAGPDDAGDQVPRIAVAVVLPQAGGGATGGQDAAPIAQSVMEAALR
jgi:penicillin-binding protein A